MIRVVLMRHGESTSDLEPRRIEGAADFPLSDRGLQQAAALGKRIAAEYQLDDLLCSPLTRARQTAEAISSATGLPAQVEPRIRERSYGLLGGLTFAEAEERFPHYNLYKLSVDEFPPEGESYLQQFHRVAEFWYSLYHGADNRTVGIVTHGGSLQCLYRLALGLPLGNWHFFACGDTSVHEWLLEPGGTVIVQKTNCTRHLEGL